MFDRLVLAAGPRSVHHSHAATITEKRAPTDESVRLLKEFEEKAEAKVVAAISVGDTTFECVLHQQEDMLSDKLLYRAIFSLNGKKMTADYEVERWRGDVQPHEILSGIRDAVAKEIATHILAETAGALRWLR